MAKKQFKILHADAIHNTVWHKVNYEIWNELWNRIAKKILKIRLFGEDL